MIKINPILLISIVALIIFCLIADVVFRFQAPGWVWIIFACATSFTFYFAGYATRMVEDVAA